MNKSLTRLDLPADSSQERSAFACPHKAVTTRGADFNRAAAVEPEITEIRRREGGSRADKTAEGILCKYYKDQEDKRAAANSRYEAAMQQDELQRKAAQGQAEREHQRKYSNYAGDP